MFRYAGASGAKIFDGVKVTAIQFQDPLSAGQQGRPVSASFEVKSSGAVGQIEFDYLV